MLTIFQALVLGLLQGVTELFPISSLGHTVIVPTLLHWNVNQHDPSFLTFIVVTHFATAIILLCFFWDDWKKIVRGMLRSLRLRRIDRDDVYARIGWLLVVSSVPVGILGILFEKSFADLFASPYFAGVFLIGNAVVLVGAEVLGRRRPQKETHSYERVSQLSWGGAVKVGLMQCLALLPGFSRTGATLSGGLLAGFSHQDAARYSFLLATPVIFAAAVLKLPELALSGASISYVPLVVGMIAAAAGAFISVRFLTNYFKKKSLIPFALYCAALGLVTVIVATMQ